eukprot:gb/GEZN01011235.1/.p1 GENE.gb/GEZN01011235.1/~~gb/GEZN01011235.1/.p1  ORF type:complete len:274 (-),score=16.45 gb/GEZN01011235.1/:328-1149(-)
MFSAVSDNAYIDESVPMVGHGPKAQGVSEMRKTSLCIFAGALLLGIFAGALGVMFLRHGSSSSVSSTGAHIASAEDAFNWATYKDGKDSKDGSDFFCEDERCDEDVNGGCNADPEVFTSATCNSIWGGKAWAEVRDMYPFGVRDTDWYLVDHPGGSLTCSIESEIPILCFLVNGTGVYSHGDWCPNLRVIGTTGHSSGPVGRVENLVAGRYVVFAATGLPNGNGIFDGYPCENNKGTAYTLAIGCGKKRVVLENEEEVAQASSADFCTSAEPC